MSGIVEFWVAGRPAPQGSKKRGEAGQMREASDYLPAWRQAVKIAALRWMKAAGVAPDDRPVFPKDAPVALLVEFHVEVEADTDKLARAVGDALTAARLWHDDRQVKVLHARTIGAGVSGTGAHIAVCAADRVSVSIN